MYLHEDSTLMWYSGSDPEGGVLLRDAPEMLAVGQVLSKYYKCRKADLDLKLVTIAKVKIFDLRIEFALIATRSGVGSYFRLRAILRFYLWLASQI